MHHRRADAQRRNRRAAFWVIRPSPTPWSCTAYNAYLSARLDQGPQAVPAISRRTNNVIATRHGQGFCQDYDDGFMPGPVSGFPCCCYNLHQGWPKMVQNAWMATADGGLIAVVYGPNVVKTEVMKTASGSTPVTIEQTTDYPFGDVITMKISVPKPTAFPLHFRIPSWADGAEIVYDGIKLPTPTAGTFVGISRQWTDGSVVTLKFPAKVRTIAGINGSTAVARGPLVYALPLTFDKKETKPDADGFYQAELTPTAPWNFALTDPTTADFQSSPPTDTPYQSPNVKLSMRARPVESWTLNWAGSAPFDPPVSPVKSDGADRTITLVPIGSTDLRVTYFPVVGEPKPFTGPMTTRWKDSGIPGWVTLGGGWMVQDGRLHTVSNAGGFAHTARGIKAVATATDYTDLTLETDVRVGPKGNAGVIFRVTDPAIGPDAYNGYYAGISAVDHCVILGRSAKAGYVELARKTLSIQPNQSVKLEVTAVGTTIDVSVDNQPVVHVKDDAHTHGSIGVRQYADDIRQTLASFGTVVATPK